MTPEEIAEARQRMKARFGGAAKIGGKGSIRRKQKVTHKTTSTDDKKLQSTLKRLGVNAIPAIEEVNMFKTDNSVIHFENPKVQASIGANTYVVSGESSTKQIQDLLPGILSQLGPENIANLRKIAEQLGAKATDEDLPAMEETDFEEAAKE